MSAAVTVPPPGEDPALATAVTRHDGGGKATGLLALDLALGDRQAQDPRDGRAGGIGRPRAGGGRR